MSSQPTPSFDDGFSQRFLTLRDHSWLDQERTPDLWEQISSCFEKFILKVRKCCMVLWAVTLVPCSKSKQKCPVSRESQEGGALAPGEGGMKDHLTNQADRYWFTWFLRTSYFPHLLSGAPPTHTLLTLLFHETPCILTANPLYWSKPEGPCFSKVGEPRTEEGVFCNLPGQNKKVTDLSTKISLMLTTQMFTSLDMLGVERINVVPDL